MLNSFSNFTKNAKGFIRNPLGIIALFISLIYGFACLILGFSTNIEPQQRWPLIYFLVLFPILILGSFVYLVAKHHKKLYGPGDFKDEKNFLTTIEPEIQNKKLLNEIKTIEENKIDVNVHKNEDKDAQDESSNSNNQKRTNNLVETIESQKLQRYMLVEDLVLRQLEVDFETPILRHVAFKSDDLPFDGVIQLNNGVFIGVEVKYIKNNTIPRSMIPSIISIASQIERESERRPEIKFKLIIAIAHEGVDIEKVRALIDPYRKQFNFPIHFKFYIMNDLMKKYGLDQLQLF